MTKNLLIVFVKNSQLGKVKTRLAKTIGDQAALEVYEELVKITETETKKVNVDRRIYFSEQTIDSKWEDDYKAVQEGSDLGDRMKNAFHKAFNDGYKKVIIIGSDLPDISARLIREAFDKLSKNEVVFGPAEDGGYYLVGFSTMKTYVFEDKPWSQSNLLAITLQELEEKVVTYDVLETLNDIDVYDDLKNYDYLLEIIKS